MRVLMMLTTLFCVDAATAALPDCTPPVEQLVWQSPAKNQTDVPTNAVIFGLPSRGHTVTVTLDGKDLQPDGDTGIDSFRFVPGPLAPNTKYALVFEVGDGATTKKFQSSFTTGDAELDEPPEGPQVTAKVDGLSTDPQPDKCGLIMGAQTCFDEDPAAHERLTLDGGGIARTLREVSADGAKSEPLLWPAECQGEIFTQPGETIDPVICWEMTSIDAAGLESEAITYCPFVAEAPAEDDGGGGRGGGGGSCVSVAHGSPGSLGLVLAMFGILLWRRRFRIS